MICDQFRENVELYALGALESSEASALSEHLATGCPSCQDALRHALHQNLLVSRTVPLVDPPARLRLRIKDSIAPASAPRRGWLPWAMAALAALLAVAVGLAIQTRFRHVEAEFAQSQSAERTRLLNTLQIVRAPGTREVSVIDPKRPQLHGALYIHQKLGLALIVDSLPSAPAGWKYESWLVPRAGAPRPVEPFHPDISGHAVSLVPGPVDVADLAAVAVSMEPLNSRPTKPTTLVFATKI